MGEPISITRKVIKPDKKALAIILGMIAGFNGMFISFFFDAPVFVSMAALLIPMVGVIVLFIQYSTVTIDAKGVTQLLRPYLTSWSLFRKPVKIFYPWHNVASYKDGEEWQRYKGNRRYLHLRMKDGYKIVIDEGDNANAQDFTDFRDKLLEYIDAVEAGTMNKSTA